MALCIAFSQVLYPAFVANLSHHRTAALEKFKLELDVATGGKDSSAASFAATARDLVAAAMAQFDAGAAGERGPAIAESRLCNLLTCWDLKVYRRGFA